MKKFHWTFHVYNTAGAIYPIGWLLYHNLHNSFVYQRYFVQKSQLRAEESFFQLFETQISDFSNQRVRPIRNSKLAIVLEDSLESVTLSSFGFVTGPFFKFSSRVTLTSVEELRKKFHNFNSLLAYKAPFVDSAKLSDIELQAVILSEDAKKFVIYRELSKADSIGQVLVPSCLSMLVFASFLFVLAPLRRFFGSVPSLTFVLLFACVASYFGIRSFLDHRVIYFDKLVCSSNPNMLKGCEEFLKKSLELGKLMRKINGDETVIGKKFAENGDDLSQNVPYSKRLSALQHYINEKAIEDMKLKQKEVSDKIRSRRIRQASAA